MVRELVTVMDSVNFFFLFILREKKNTSEYDMLIETTFDHMPHKEKKQTKKWSNNFLQSVKLSTSTIEREMRNARQKNNRISCHTDKYIQ